jgi:hypothetical protein
VDVDAHRLRGGLHRVDAHDAGQRGEGEAPPGGRIEKGSRARNSASEPEASFFKAKLVPTRVARWFFQNKNTTLGKFWKALEWKTVYFMTIWNILLPSAIIYRRLV